MLLRSPTWCDREGSGFIFIGAVPHRQKSVIFKVFIYLWWITSRIRFVSQSEDNKYIFNYSDCQQCFGGFFVYKEFKLENHFSTAFSSRSCVNTVYTLPDLNELLWGQIKMAFSVYSKRWMLMSVHLSCSSSHMFPLRKAHYRIPKLAVSHHGDGIVLKGDKSLAHPILMYVCMVMYSSCSHLILRKIRGAP